MCTVTYLPINDTTQLITSNRDVHRERALALPPEVQSVENRHVLYPKDPVGGGTWIALGKNTSVCLLNGAFKAHQPRVSYRHSRGLIPLHIMQYSSIHNFVEQYDFEDLEPFTLVVVHRNELFEIRWDEQHIHTKQMDKNQPHIWASSPLYSQETIRQRQEWFKDWLSSNPIYTPESIMDFHKNYGENDPENGLIINRKIGVRTVSITSMLYNESSGKMVYDDLVSNQISRNHIDFS